MSDAKWAVARREVNEMLSSRKFIGVFAVFLLLNFASVWISRDVIIYDENPMLISTFEPLVRFNLPLAAAALGISLSYNTVTRERESGTLELLLSYPVYRDEVVNGKLIANLFTVAIALFVSMTASLGLAMQLTGLQPVAQSIVRLGLVWVGTVVYTSLFVAMGTMFSTVFSSSWRSLGVSAVVLMVFLSAPLTTSVAANAIYPSDGPVENEDQREMNRNQLKESLLKLSPTSAYKNYVSRMLGANFNQYDIRPSVAQTFRDTRGYIVYLLSETFLAFTLSYAAFVRREMD